MAANMSPTEAVKQFGVRLLKELPLEEDIFLDMVDAAGLLGLSYKSTIKAKPTRHEKVASFKDKVLEPGPDIQLPKLLDVMDKSDDLNAQNLAKDIRKATGLKKSNPGKSSSSESTSPKGGETVNEEAPIAGLSIKDEEKDDVIVEKLWSEAELMQKFNDAKDPAFLTNLADDEQKDVLQKVVVLLLTVNDKEALATRNYLEPFDERGDVYEFTKCVTFGGGKVSNYAIYYIGKFGACPAAITTIPPGSEVRGGAINVPMMAYESFPNIGAIIGVGVACGVKAKVKMCDVLVSTQVVNYDQGRAQKGGFEQRGTRINASSYLRSLFTQLVKWPNDSIKQRLTDSKMPIPNIKPGVILSGPYLIDDPNFQDVLIESFASNAIGIEMEGAYLFAATEEAATNVIIVKAVCDYGDGNKHKKYQPTAALLAADFVHKKLSGPQVPDMIKAKKV